GSADLADVLTAAGPGGSAVLERLAEWRGIRLTETVAAAPVPGVESQSESESESQSESQSESESRSESESGPIRYGVELTHRGLGRDWPRLRSWLSERTDAERLRQLVASAAAEWV